MAKIIKLEEIQKNSKKFYEICSDISVLQRELDQMLTAIERNSIDFEKGKISKDLFEYNENRMKKESAKIIKKINSLVDLGISLINKINKEVLTQKIETKEKTKKKKIKEIKKSLKKRRIRKKKKAKKKSKKKPKSVPETKTETIETTQPAMPTPPETPTPTQ